MTFTLSYRPVRFSDVVGQRHVTPVLKAMVRSGAMRPSLVFAGTRGTGKTSCARIMAAALNCDHGAPGDACGECESCRAVQQTNSMSVLEQDAASNGGVEDVRRIQELCRYAHDGKWRVVLFDEAHSMSREAFNALLKALEEPPPQTIFVLLTTEVDKIPDTVRSRSMVFEFFRLSEADILTRLHTIVDAEGLAAEEDLLVEVARRAEGGLRDAVMVLDQVSLVGIKDADGFRALFGCRDISVDVFTAAFKADYAEGYRLIEEHFHRTGDAAGLVTDLTRLVRDVLVLQAGGVLERSDDAVQARQRLAGWTSTPQLVKVMETLWELKARVRAVDNDQRASMDMAFALLSEALNLRAQPGAQPIQTASEPRRMTLADVQKAAGRT